MELSQYVEALRHELAAAAGAGTEETRRVAELLSGALDSAVRLVIMDVQPTSSTRAWVRLRLSGMCLCSLGRMEVGF